jgi:uncharacterized protein (TIGR03083 family)
MADTAEGTVPEFDKSRLVNALGEEWGTIAEVCEGFDTGQWDRPTDCPGWTVKDNLSHMVGTELSIEGASPPDIQLDDPARFGNPMAEVNEKWVQARRDLPGAEVLAEFRAVTAGRLETLNALTQTDFDAPTWTPIGDATLGRFMRIRIFDCWMHEQDIREATGLPGHLSGLPVDLTVEETSESMGYAVGKLGGAPDGARVRIDLTGPTSATIRVAVDGRAQVVRSFDGEPTIGLTLPTALFMRLCGARTTAEEGLQSGVIKLSGDEAAARRIALHLGFTF